MLVIEARNVNGAWKTALEYVLARGEKATSRSGDVLVAPTPVTTVYERPTERVLFDPYRDANPFFHFFECLWMLSGSRDPAFLNLFVKDFGSRFAEPKTGLLYGAYGERWRSGFAMDQLNAAVRRLSKKPDDRRTVIAMWDPYKDLWDPEDLVEGEQEPRDLPCNTHVYLLIRDGRLDMTVCCRSNDIVWGAYGANAVHFSFLQEYLAGRIGVGVGRLYQVSNNWHAYASELEKYVAKNPRMILTHDLYPAVTPSPIGDDWGRWDGDLGEFMKWTKLGQGPSSYSNVWFSDVAERMWLAHRCWREKQPREAMFWVNQVGAMDWRAAAGAWLARRIGKMEAA